MTAIWGPLGWMTLHSISLVYPESPSVTDKIILKRFMELFRDTITCPYCQRHFKVIFENYVASHLDWSNSRFDFFMFIVRAHNTVNKRLEKPRIDSVQACIDRYNENTKINSGVKYRHDYISYLSRNYSQELSGEGMMKLSMVRELRKINEEYWNMKDDSSTSSFDLSANTLAFINEDPNRRNVLTSSGLSPIPGHNFRIGLRGGRFRLA